ncbi:hypothetical protein WMY93_031272, partial [Mugilogobius chulae]
MTAFRVSVSSSVYNQWERAFAVCNSVAQHDTTDGRIGVARLAKNMTVEVPPQSELMVWANVFGATRLPHGDVLVESTTEGMEWQVARTLCNFKGGKIPVRIQNVNPYPVTIPPRQALASVFLLSPEQIRSDSDLVLTATDSNTIEVDIRTTSISPSEDHPVKMPSNKCLNGEQQRQMEDLVRRWSSVFATSEDDFGRTDAVLHQIPTGTAPPSRE